MGMIEHSVRPERLYAIREKEAERRDIKCDGKRWKREVVGERKGIGSGL